MASNGRDPTLSAAIGLSAAAIPAIVLTQQFFSAKFISMELVLPYPTEFALGPVLPLILTGLLAATIFVKLRLGSQGKRVCEVVVVIVIGGIVGLLIVAIWAAFPISPASLS